MMENDDTLIKNFMLANKHEIEDNGFSRGVIRRLPQPAQWLSDILSVTCAIVCCALFYIFNGFEILCQTISDIVTSQTYYLVSDTNFQSLVIATAVLIIIGLQSILIQIVRNRIITLPLILMPIINLKHLFSYWLRIADLPRQ